jgi:hypothetical protein
LVHKLRELATAEKLFHRCHHGLSVDQVMRQHCLHVQEIHALFNAALHPHEAQPELVFQQLADRPHATIAQVVDVVDLAATNLKVHQVPHHFDDILSRQSPLLEREIETQLFIELEPPDRR